MTDNVGTVTGALTSGNTTDDTALVLSGTNESGSSVKVYNGSTELGAATVSGTSWSYSATVANGTTYQFNVKETDLTGNTSAATINFAVTGDTSAPLVNSFTLSDTALKAGETATVTLVFSEAVASFSSSADITVANGTLAVMSSADNITWAGTFTPTANTEDASNTLSLATSYTDTAGNAGAAATTANYAVETQAPTVSSVSTTADNQSLVSITDNITVTFSEAMEPSYVTTSTSDTNCAGSIRVSSDNFSSCVRMSREPVSSNSNMTFTLDPYDNLTIGTTYLIRVTTAAKDTAGNALSSQYDNSTGFTIVDVIAPTVTNVSSSTDNGSYKINDNITVIVTFSESVIVDNSSGNPRILLETGTNDRYANYISGNSTSTLSFLYTVQSGDNSIDLDYNGTDSISVNSGTIRDNANNDSTLTLSSPGESGSISANKAIVIDTTAPTVSSISPTDNQSGVSITNISVTFSEAMDNTSVTTNTSNTTCSGSFALSSDNFSSCLKMSSSPSSSNSYTTFTVASDNFSFSTTYKTRVTTGVKDTAGNTLSSQYETSSGYTTISGLFVGVGASGTIVTSSDNGTTWTSRTSGTSNIIYGVGYGNNTFVAVGSEGTILTSSDGISWTSRTSGTSYELQGITYGNSIFVAAGISKTVLTSSDGISWTERNTCCGSTLADVIYANSIFVTVGSGGAILTSSDGISWTLRTSGTSSSLEGITYGNSIFVASGGSGTILTSSDGISWTERNSGSEKVLSGITFVNSIFVTVGNSGTILTSSDGTSWTSRTSGITNDLREITFGNSIFVAVGTGGKILTSSDGTSWTLREDSETGGTLSAVTYSQ